MKIYVGNLPYSMDNDALSQLFAEFGEVDSANVIMDRDSGRSRGFGFVEMSDDEQARQAIEAVDGRDVDGRALKVNEARPQKKRGGGGGGGRRGGGRRGY